MSDVHYKKHRVFRETEDVIFYDISVEESNASEEATTKKDENIVDAEYEEVDNK